MSFLRFEFFPGVHDLRALKHGMFKKWMVDDQLPVARKIYEMPDIVFFDGTGSIYIFFICVGIFVAWFLCMNRYAECDEGEDEDIFFTYDH